MKIITAAIAAGPSVYQFILDYKARRDVANSWKNLTPQQQQQANQILQTSYVETLAGYNNIYIG